MESGDCVITLLWYRSQTTIKKIKADIAEANERIGRPFELVVKSHLEGVIQMLETGQVSIVFVELDAPRISDEGKLIKKLQMEWTEVFWIGVLDTMPEDRMFVLNHVHEFLWMKEIKAETLAERLIKPRHIYERLEALGLPGVVDHSRGAEIERILSEQTEIKDYEVEALMHGMMSSEKKKMKFKFGTANRRAEKGDVFNHCRMKLSVVGKSDYGCELGWVISNKFHKKTLILDADRLQPSIDLLLDVKRTTNYGLNGMEELQQTGMNVLLDAIRKNNLTGDKFFRACARVKGNAFLYALTGSYNLSDYEYYDKNDYLRLVEKASEYFDVVILLVNGFIYDAFTAISLVLSDKNILPVGANVLEVRSIASAMGFVCERQSLDLRKNLFVAYDVEDKSIMSEEDYEVLSGNRYLGSIPSHQKRVKARGEGRLYGPGMDGGVLEAHEKIILRILNEMRC